MAYLIAITFMFLSLKYFCLEGALKADPAGLAVVFSNQIFECFTVDLGFTGIF